MANILRVTTPPTEFESTPKTNPISIQDQNIHNIIDPTKVTRPDGKEGSGQEKFQLLDFESNFDNFIQMVKQFPSLRTEMVEFLMFKLDTMVTSGIKENFAEEIARFMELMQMESPEELLSFVKEQSDTAVKFKGPFFDILREALTEPGGEELRNKVVDFLKKYNDFTASDHILKNIASNLKNISEYMLPTNRESLLKMMEQMQLEPYTARRAQTPGTAPDDAVAHNSVILKEQIIPYLSEYIKRTHDLGKIRDIITMLTLNIARYENVGQEGFLDALAQLLKYNTVKQKLNQHGGQEVIEQMLQKKGERTQFSLIDRLMGIVKKGMEGEAGLEHKGAFQNILRANLMNESVYMPVLHFMVPVTLNGVKLFSEMWVDPDAEGETEQHEDMEKSTKLLIKFDIQNVGFFDLIIFAKGSKVEVQLYYPEKLQEMEKTIREGIGEIMEKNNLTATSLTLEKSIKPKAISEVFPKIYERKNSVNVTV